MAAAARVHREFQAAGFALAAGAARAVAERLGAQDDEDKFLDDVVEAAQALCEAEGSAIVSDSIATRALHAVEAGAAAADTGVGGGVEAIAAGDGAGAAAEPVRVLGAFHMPRLTYDLALRRFRELEGAGSLLGDAGAKTAAARDRLHLLQERMSMLPGLAKAALPTAPAGAGGSDGSVDIVTVQSLLGAGLGRKRYIMGALSQPREGHFALEDTTGTVPLDLSAAQTIEGDAALYTESCVVLLQGVMRATDGVFEVQMLGMPPLVTREEAAKAGHAVMGASAAELSDREALAEAEKAAEADMVVLLADVRLDDAAAVERLTKVLAGFEGAAADDAAAPTMFVLMGDFVGGESGAWGGAGGGGGGGSGEGSATAHASALARRLGELGELLEAHPNLAARSHFVLVPGPGDPSPGSALPRPPLPDFVTARLTAIQARAKLSLTLATNPCRVRFYTQELVIHRTDLPVKMRRLAIRPPAEVEAMDEGEGGEAGPLFGLASTVLQQAYLSPLPLSAQPVYWDFDTSLRLHDSPDVLVLADGGASGTCGVKETQAINPGSLAAEGTFAVYLPASRKVQLSAVE